MPADPPITVLCPSGASIKSTHTAEFNFKNFPPNQRVHVFPSLASGSLLSIGQLCDVGCHAYFHKNNVKVIYQNNIILSGTRTSQTNGLWSISIPPSSISKIPACNGITPTATVNNKLPENLYACNVLTPHDNKTETIKFLQASMGYPTKTSLSTAVKKSNLASFPGGVSVKQINKHYTPIDHQ